MQDYKKDAWRELHCVQSCCKLLIYFQLKSRLAFGGGIYEYNDN